MLRIVCLCPVKLLDLRKWKLTYESSFTQRYTCYRWCLFLKLLGVHHQKKELILYKKRKKKSLKPTLQEFKNNFHFLYFALVWKLLMKYKKKNAIKNLQILIKTMKKKIFKKISIFENLSCLNHKFQKWVWIKIDKTFWLIYLFILQLK